MNRMLALVLLIVAAGCSPSPRQPSAPETRALDFDSITKALQSHRLTFEIRGLRTESEDWSTGNGKSFRHRGTVVAVGDTALARGSYLVICRVKRIGGGDPNNLRQSDDISNAWVLNGVGEFLESGGIRTKYEDWETEKIQVTPIAAIPAISFEAISVTN